MRFIALLAILPALALAEPTPVIQGPAVVGVGQSAQAPQGPLALSGNLCASKGSLTTCQLLNAQTGTSYAVAAGDAGKLITFNNGSPVAVTLAQANTAGFSTGFSFDTQNLGAGTVTITPITSTINGSSTLAIGQNTGCSITSDGSNYQVSACTAVGTTSGSAFNNVSSGTNTTAAMVLGAGSSLIPSGGVVQSNNVVLPNLAVSGNQSAANSWIYQNSTLAGTASSSFTPPRFAPLWFATTNDQVVCSGSALCGSFFLYDDLKAGWDGNHNLANLYFQVDAPPVTAGANAVGMNLLVNANSTLGGLPGSWGGAAGPYFAFNPNLFANGASSMQNTTLFTTAEFDTLIAAGNSTSEKHQLTLVTGPLDAVQGTYQDSALLFATQDNSNTSAWSLGIEFGGIAHNAPLNASSTMIGATKRSLGFNTSPIALYGIDWSQMQFQSGGGFLKSYGYLVDPTGNANANTLTVGASGISQKSATITSIASVAFGNVTGGSYFNSASFPSIHIQASQGGGTQATATVATMKLTAALFTPGGDSGCTNGQTLTTTGGSGSQGTITVSGNSPITALTVATGGSFTAISATPGITGGACSIPSIQLGYGIATTTVTNAGTLYDCAPPPFINSDGSPYLGTVNTPAHLSATMACTNLPVLANNGFGSPNETLTSGVNSDNESTLKVNGTQSATGALAVGIWDTQTFTPSGATNVDVFQSQSHLGASSGSISNYEGVFVASMNIDAGYGISNAPPNVQNFEGCNGWTDSRASALTNPVVNYRCYVADALFNGNNSTAGSINNTQFYANGTNNSGAATSNGSAIINSGFLAVISNGGSTAGSTENDGILITGNGGTASGGTVNNFAIKSTSSALSSLAGGLQVFGGTVTLNGGSSNNPNNLNTGTSTGKTTLGNANNTTDIESGKLTIAAVLYASSTIPVIASGFNTSSGTVSAASTASFSVTVGTGAGTSTGVLTMPAAATGWACHVADVTTPATHNVVQTASSSTSVTVTDYGRVSGLAQNMVNSDVLEFLCGAN